MSVPLIIETSALPRMLQRCCVFNKYWWLILPIASLEGHMTFWEFVFITICSLYLSNTVFPFRIGTLFLYPQCAQDSLFLIYWQWWSELFFHSSSLFLFAICMRIYNNLTFRIMPSAAFSFSSGDPRFNFYVLGEISNRGPERRDWMSCASTGESNEQEVEALNESTVTEVRDGSGWIARTSCCIWIRKLWS